MAKRIKREKKSERYVVVSYIDDTRRLHEVEATSYRDSKRQVARELREELGLFDVNLSDITSQGMLISRKVPRKQLQ